MYYYNSTKSLAEADGEKNNNVILAEADKKCLSETGKNKKNLKKFLEKTQKKSHIRSKIPLYIKYS